MSSRLSIASSNIYSSGTISQGRVIRFFWSKGRWHFSFSTIWPLLKTKPKPGEELRSASWLYCFLVPFKFPSSAAEQLRGKRPTSLFWAYKLNDYFWKHSYRPVRGERSFFNMDPTLEMHHFFFFFGLFVCTKLFLLYVLPFHACEENKAAVPWKSNVNFNQVAFSLHFILS